DFNGTDGHTEFAIPVIPSLSPQDYVAIGRMPDNTPICPVRNISNKACSSIYSAIAQQVMDVLEDYGGIRQVPSPKNIRSLVLDIATSEFITKPFFCLLKIREGMGIFWEKITSAEIKSIYDLSAPMVTRTCHQFFGSDSFGRQRAASLSLVTALFEEFERRNYYQFSEILHGNRCDCTRKRSIAVDVELMAPEAVRPKSFTCFRKLILPRNYQSSFEMRNKLGQVPS
ncbi:hypothetical protein QZH41_017415, partial [Actinostola sp. cb2023]